MSYEQHATRPLYKTTASNSNDDNRPFLHSQFDSKFIIFYTIIVRC